MTVRLSGTDWEKIPHPVEANTLLIIDVLGLRWSPDRVAYRIELGLPPGLDGLDELSSCSGAVGGFAVSGPPPTPKIFEINSILRSTSVLVGCLGVVTWGCICLLFGSHMVLTSGYKY